MSERTAAMKFDEIHDPKCDRCGALSIRNWSVRVDESDNVVEVFCVSCAEAEVLAKWDKDRRLSSGGVLTAGFKTRSILPRLEVDASWYEIEAASDRVREVVKAYFEPAVWFGHAGERFVTTSDGRGGRSCGFGKGRSMAKAVRASQSSLMTSGKVTDGTGVFSVKTWSTAGRCLIEIGTDDASVTLITAEDEDTMRMGIQGIDATEGEAIDLLNRAEMAWRAGAFELRGVSDE